MPSFSYQSGINVRGAAAATNLIIPTHISPAGGQTTHPSVLFFEEKWNGYHYWMAHTPYPAGNDDHEDPNLAVSNDGTNWIAAPGVPQPLDDADGNPEYNSDVNLVMGPPATMYLFWRYLDTSLPSAQEKIYVRTSTDGVTWTPKHLVWSSNMADRQYVSPHFEWVDDKWRMWAVNIAPAVNTIVHRQTSAALPTPSDWGAETVCTTSNAMQTGKEPWHIGMVRIAGQYVMILNDCTIGQSGLDGDLMLMTSHDGLSWTGPGAPVLDRVAAGKYDNLYKASLVPTMRDGELGLEVFYSAWLNTSPRVWNVYRSWLGKVSTPAETGSATLTTMITFTSVPTLTLHKTGGVAIFRFNGTKGTGTTAANTNLVAIPAGFRSSWNVWGHAWVVGSTTPLQVYYDAGSDTIKSTATIAGGASIAMTLIWNVTE
jgi:hypothetical protein